MNWTFLGADLPVYEYDLTVAWSWCNGQVAAIKPTVEHAKIAPEWWIVGLPGFEVVKFEDVSANTPPKIDGNRITATGKFNACVVLPTFEAVALAKWADKLRRAMGQHGSWDAIPEKERAKLAEELFTANTKGKSAFNGAAGKIAEFMIGKLADKIINTDNDGLALFNWCLPVWEPELIIEVYPDGRAEFIQSNIDPYSGFYFTAVPKGQSVTVK